MIDSLNPNIWYRRRVGVWCGRRVDIFRRKNGFSRTIAKSISISCLK